jgi:salicylate hydroxylase
MATAAEPNTIIIAGGGIGGLATALALAQRGHRSTVLEQASQLGEIGAGIQLGPNAFRVLDQLGLGGALKETAVFIDRLIMMDSLSEETIVNIPVDEPFRRRFGNPYAVIHRADLHSALADACRASPLVSLLTSQRVAGFADDGKAVEVWTEAGERHRGAALVGADGLHSKIRAAIVADGAPRVPGHITYRAVLPIEQMPEDMRWNAATLWGGPNTHLVHYPLRGWKLFNIVATFHGDRTTEGANEEGSREEILEAYSAVGPKPRSIIETPKSWRKWVLADREPVENWTKGRVTLLGDAAHPMLQYMAQGACMAMEDGVVLAAAVDKAEGDMAEAFSLYQNARLTRTARMQWSARMMGEIFHAKGPYRLIRSEVFGKRSPEQYYDGLAWIYDGPPPL